MGVVFDFGDNTIEHPGHGQVGMVVAIWYVVSLEFHLILDQHFSECVS